jgi:hypothetical protein
VLSDTDTLSDAPAHSDNTFDLVENIKRNWSMITNITFIFMLGRKCRYVLTSFLLTSASSELWEI